MVLFLTEAEVEQLIDSDRYLVGAVDVLERGFRDYAAGEIVTPKEERMRMVWPIGQTTRPYDRDIRIVPAMVPGIDTAGIHIGANSQDEDGFTSYQILMDFRHLGPLAIIEDKHMHSVRAGSPTGIAVRHLARPDARTLGVIGTGTIAAVQIAVACGQRPIDTVRVYSPNPEHRAQFAATWSARLDRPVTAVGSAREAIEGADVVTIATNSYNQPVLDGAWLAPGALLASVTPGEIDRRTVERSRVIATSLNRMVADYTPWEPVTSALRDGTLDQDNLPLLGDVLLGRTAGRERDDQIIFFSSPGIGFCDVVVARWVYDLAVAQGVGRAL